jgi:polysaccharide biosynthesis protein PslG
MLGRMRRLLLIPLTAALLALVPATAGAPPVPAPPGFIGISPQGHTQPQDYELMRQAGISSVRLPMNWQDLMPNPYERFDPNWGWFDEQVGFAAEQGLRAFPFIWGTPEWVSPRLGAEPVTSARQRREWLRFLRGAVLRYGPRGSFWSENEELPRLPVRQWEIWNEENIVTFSREPDPIRFARLVRISGRLLHRFDPGSTVILGGFFGRPLQIPPNIHSATFLADLYEVPGIKRYFDGVALHPYVADAGAMEGQIEDLREVMRLSHDVATKLYVTEMGWGSDGFESRWERGPRGQARELDHSFALLTGNRQRWRIGGVWWFSWFDQAGSCQFCDSAGLLTTAREAKPSWYRFNAWTGGDARTVPRASARALRQAP